MKQPEEVKREFTRQWLEKANGDYSTSNHLLSSGDAYLEAAAFHAQQAAEKYLKALLVWYQIEFPKTHDLSLLISLASSRSPELVESLSAVQLLTPYGVEYRYPGDYPDINKEDAHKAFETAGKVRAEIIRRLPTGIL